MDGADVGAEAAAGAERRADDRAAFGVGRNRGAAYLAHASAAFYTFIVYEVRRGFFLHVRYAGRFGYDRGGAFVCDGRLHRGDGFFKIERVDARDVLHAAGAQQRLYVERYAVVAERALSRAGVRLVAGHRCRAVVEDYYRDVRSLVDGVDYAGDSGVEEGRVADEGEALRARLGQREPLGERYACAHAEAGVDHVERRGVAERVAADVAAVNRFFAVLRRYLRLVERSAVRAARAEHRRAHWKLRKLGRDLGFGG